MIREVCTRNRQQTVIKSSEHEECSVLDARLTTASTSNCNDTTTTTHVWINCHVGFTCGDACTTHGSVRAALAVGRCSGSMVSSNATNSYASPAHTHTHTHTQRERERHNPGCHTHPLVTDSPGFKHVANERSRRAWTICHDTRLDRTRCMCTLRTPITYTGHPRASSCRRDWPVWCRDEPADQTIQTRVIKHCRKNYACASERRPSHTRGCKRRCPTACAPRPASPAHTQN